jgi:hypothetical protein
MVKGDRLSRRTVDQDDLPRCVTTCYLIPTLPMPLENKIEWSKHQVLYPGRFATRSME